MLSVSLALGGALLLGRFTFRDVEVPLFLFALAVAAWYGGTGAAVLALLLSCLSFDYFFVEPLHTLYISGSDLPYFIVFALFALLVTWFSDEVVILTQSEVQRNKVALRMELAANLPPVMGDRVQLQQEVVNLILNAIEAMSTVEGHERDLIIRTLRCDGDQVRVAVQDSGIGLDPKSEERIFDAFHTTKPGGLGMGLSISRSIVESHGGRLWATSNDGPGATFQFTL